MKRSIRAYIYIVIWMVPFFSSSFLFAEENSSPSKLDDAHIGPASEANPLFSNVLKNPVVDSDWIKVGDNAYIGPSGSLFIYDALKGEIEQGGQTAQVGEYTYDEDGNILRALISVKDSQNTVIGYYDFSSYLYNSKGLLINYSRVDRDKDGNMLKLHEYSNITYTKNEKLISYKRCDYDADNKKKFLYEFQFDKAEKFISYSRISYDENGAVTLTSLYSDFSYNVTGQIDSYTRTDKDAIGNVIAVYEYSEFLYSEGAVVGYQRVDINEDGTIMDTQDILITGN